MQRVFSILGRISGCVFSSHQDSCTHATSGVFAPVELKIGVNTIVVKSNLGCLPRVVVGQLLLLLLIVIL